MLYIGIDVGGTGLKVGLVDEEGNILCKRTCPTRPKRGYEAVIRDIVTLVRLVIKDSGRDEAEIAALGCGIPGIYDVRTGRVPFCTNLGWHDIPLRDMLQAEFNKPFFAGNDASVAALAEYFLGACQGVDNAVVVTLGTGVGCGVILGGKLFMGTYGCATEVGHVITVVNGIECTCGNRGCWERYASASALIREGKRIFDTPEGEALNNYVGGDIDNIEARNVIELAKRGDMGCGRLFDEYVYHVAVGLVNIINFYDPAIIALGGGVSKAGDFLLDKVKALLPGLVFFKTMPHAEIKLAALSNDAGIIGAALFGREELGK